jgi:molybdopterin converting factor subunit 1
MNVRIKLFAAAKERAGVDEVVLSLAEGANVADARRALIAEKPALAALVPYSLWAIDAEYVDDQTKIDDNVEVALIPPVSGG